MVGALIGRTDSRARHDECQECPALHHVQPHSSQCRTVTIGPKSNRRKNAAGIIDIIGVEPVAGRTGMLACPILNIAETFWSLLVYWRMQCAPEAAMRWPPTSLRPADPLPTRQPRLLLGCRAPSRTGRIAFEQGRRVSILMPAARLAASVRLLLSRNCHFLSRAVLLTAAANSTIFLFPVFLFNSALTLRCAYLASRLYGQDMERNDDG